MSADMELRNTPSLITEPHDQNMENTENQDERYTRLKNEIIDGLQNEIRKVVIDQMKIEISKNFMEEAYPPLIQYEEPLCLANSNNLKRQLTTKQQSYDRFQNKIEIPLPQREDISVSQRSVDRDDYQECLPTLAFPSSHITDVSLGNYN